MHRSPVRSLFAVAVVTTALLALVPRPLASQDGLWDGELVRRVDSLAAVALEEGPVASLAVGVRSGDVFEGERVADGG